MKRLRGVFKRSNSKASAVTEGPDEPTPPKDSVVAEPVPDEEPGNWNGNESESELSGGATDSPQHYEGDAVQVEPVRSSKRTQREKRGTEDMVASLLATKKLDIRASQRVGPRPQSLAIEEANELVRKHKSSREWAGSRADSAMESLLRPASVRTKPPQAAKNDNPNGLPEERLMESYNRLSQRLRAITGPGGLGDFVTKPLPSHRSHRQAGPGDAGGLVTNGCEATAIPAPEPTRSMAKVPSSVSNTLQGLYAQTRGDGREQKREPSQVDNVREELHHCADRVACESLDLAIQQYSGHTGVLMRSCTLYRDEWAIVDRQMAAKETEGCGINGNTCPESLLSFVRSVLGLKNEAWELRSPADLRRIAAILASCVGKCTEQVADAQKQGQSHRETAANRTKSLAKSGFKTSFTEWKKSFYERFTVRTELFSSDVGDVSRSLEALGKGRGSQLGGWGSRERAVWTNAVAKILSAVRGICVLADEISLLTKFLGCVVEGSVKVDIGVSWSSVAVEKPRESYESMLNASRCAVLGQEMSHWLCVDVLERGTTPGEDREGGADVGADAAWLPKPPVRYEGSDAADKMIDKLRMDIHRLRVENEELGAKLEEARADASVAEIRLDDAKREVVSVMKDLATIQADRQSIEGELHAARVKDYYRKVKCRAFFHWHMSVKASHMANCLQMERMEVMRKGLQTESLRDTIVNKAVRGGEARSVMSGFYRWRGNSGKSKAGKVVRIIQVDAWRRLTLSKFLGHWRRRADIRRVDQLMMARHKFKSVACSFYTWKSFQEKASTRSFARRCDKFSQAVSKSYWARVDLLAGWEAFRWNRDVCFAISRVSVHTKSHAFRRWKYLNVSAHNIITTVKRVIRRLRLVSLVRGLTAFRRNVIGSEVRDRYQVAMHLRRVFAKWKRLAAGRSHDLRLLCKATTRWVASTCARAWTEWYRTAISRRRLRNIGKGVLLRWRSSRLAKAITQWEGVVQANVRLRFVGRHWVRRAEARVLRHWAMVSQGGSDLVVYRSTLAARWLHRRRRRRAIVRWHSYVYKKKRRLESAHLKANLAGYLVPQQAAFKMWTDFVANIRRRTRIMDGVLRLERRTLHKWLPRKRMPYFQHWVDMVRQRKEDAVSTPESSASPEVSAVRGRVLSGVHGSVHGEPVSSNESAKLLLATTDIETMPPPVNAPELYESAL